MFIVNFKTYESGTGKKGLELAKICEKVSKKTNVAIAVAVQATDIRMISSSVSIEVYAQHVDAITHGKHNGYNLPEAIKEAGAAGSFIGHSEHRLDAKDVEFCVKRLKELGLKSVVFAGDTKHGTRLSKLNPDYICVEPPELVGGGISIADAEPDLIKKSVETLGKNVLVGAGVGTGEDARIVKRFGACGMVASNRVMKSSNPEKVILEIVEGFV